MKNSFTGTLVAVLLLAGAVWAGSKWYRCHRLQRDYEHRLAEIRKTAESTLLPGIGKEAVEKFFRSQGLQYSFYKPKMLEPGDPPGTDLIGAGFVVIKICDSLACNGDVHIAVHTSFGLNGLLGKTVRQSFTCL